jgi:hypothetical protein
VARRGIVPEAIGTSVGKAEPCQIVDERVDPHVDDLRRITWIRDTPATGPRCVARDRDVGKPARNETQNLSLACFRNHAHSARCDELVQLRLIRTQTEEPIVFRDLDERRAVLRAPTVDLRRSLDKSPRIRAVQATVVGGVDVARPKASDECLDGSSMREIGGALKVVERHIERVG